MANHEDPRSAQHAPVSRRPAIAVFTSHWLAMTGFGLLLTAIVAWACLIPAHLRRGQDNPYVGVAMATVAAVFVLGLILTPIGVLFGRRRLQQRLAAAGADGGFAWRRFLVFLLVVSLVNLAIASQLTVRVVHAMESRQFCASCHVMTPEARAFEQGPHAGLVCVDCHAGEGALGFVKSKMQGTRQLLSVVTDRVHKPIETAIESGRMVPSEETCENCHWKGQFAKVSLKMIRRYGEDEANTPETTILTMNVGGTKMGGIHGAHHGEGIEISFVATDRKRQEIPLVEYRNTVTSQSRTYVKAGANAAALADQPRIRMQCFDCHNRPAHAFDLPDRAVDRALVLGRIAVNLPFLKKAAVEILKTDYPSSEAAAAAIPAALAAFYAKSNPAAARDRAADIQEAGSVLADIYSRNVFPELGVTWGTYPDNLGHQDSPGCFRCHDGDHETATGEKITKNCFRCHFPSSVGDEKPEILELLGLDKMLQKLEKKK